MSATPSAQNPAPPERRQMEQGVTNERVADVSSTIGNLIRVALAVQVDEAQTACVIATLQPLHIRLLDPRQPPASAADHQANRQLLEAFAQFRRQLEMIRNPLPACADA
jgi:hypothetical protein